MSLIAKVYPIFLTLSKTQLLKCLKGTVWEHPSADNVETGAKHYWDLQESTFTLLLHYSEMNWMEECFSYSDLKS